MFYFLVENFKIKLIGKHSTFSAKFLFLLLHLVATVSIGFASSFDWDVHVKVNWAAVYTEKLHWLLMHVLPEKKRETKVQRASFFNG